MLQYSKLNYYSFLNFKSLKHKDTESKVYFNTNPVSYKIFLNLNNLIDQYLINLYFILKLILWSYDLRKLYLI